MSGQDPMANIQDIMGYQGLVGQNPYLQYQGQIPMAGYQTRSPFTGPVVMGPQDTLPTDAEGNPIQPPYGTTTLNSLPQQAPPAAPSQPQGLPPQYVMNNAMINAMGQGAAGGYGPGTGQFGQAASAGSGNIGQQMSNAINMRAMNNAQYNQGGFGPGYWGGPGIQAGVAGTLPKGVLTSNMDPAQDLAALNAYGAQVGYPNVGGQGGQSGGASSGGGGGAAPQTGLTRDQYLYLLSNPHPQSEPVYGAAPPQPGQTLTGSSQQPTVIQSFLAAHPGGGTTGAGGYSNQGFFNTLKQLQGS